MAMKAKGGRTGKVYPLRVDDKKGRVFTDPDTGEEYDDAKFKEMEDDYTTEAEKSTEKGKDSTDPNKVNNQIRSAPQKKSSDTGMKMMGIGMDDQKKKKRSGLFNT